MIYEILDEQAVVRAATTAAKRRSTDDGDDGKKRTRKKKAAAPAPAPEANAQQAPAEGEQPAETAAAAEAPKRRRGRPSKKKLPSARRRLKLIIPKIFLKTIQLTCRLSLLWTMLRQQSHRPTPAQPHNAEEARQQADAQADHTDEQQQPEPRKRDFRPQGDFSLFFPTRGEGRKFVPRSQQEKEQVRDNNRTRTEQAAPAPITLVEPGQPMPQQQNGKRKE